jgi:hypothetical protein
MYCTLQLGTTLVTLRGTTLVTLRYPNIRANASLLRLPVLQRLVIEFLELVEFASRTSLNRCYIMSLSSHRRTAEYEHFLMTFCMRGAVHRAVSRQQGHIKFVFMSRGRSKEFY